MAVGLLDIPPEHLWQLTPAELILMLEAKAEERKEHYNEIVYSAWLTAGLVRQKKLPKLESLIVTEKKRKRVSPEEKRKQLDELKKIFGRG